VREIKFRAWNKELFVMYTIEKELKHKNLWAIPKAIGGILDYPNGVLMQYTGLKDKKRTKEYPEGQEIYEGDIVEHIETDKGWHTTQEYKKINVIRMEHYNKYTDLWSFYKYEVIGNIYENPELLERNK